MDRNEQSSIVVDRIVEALQDLTADETWIKRVADAAETDDVRLVSTVLWRAIGAVENEFGV